MFILENYRVSFNHDRLDLMDYPINAEFKNYNGSTLCRITNIETGSLISFGWHTCQKRGCFNKNKQRKEAMKHALLSFSRESRSEFWNMYFRVRGRIN